MHDRPTIEMPVLPDAGNLPSDYVARRLASDAVRLRLDSHRPENDTRRTRELPAVFSLGEE